MKSKQYYISINEQEMGVLREASYIEVAFYLVLKELANFKTGDVGNFRNQKITYAGLAARLSRPSSQGKAEVKICRDEARRHALRLVQLGLVANLVVGKEKITLTLPLSPLKEQSTESSSVIEEKTYLPPTSKSLDFGDVEDSSMTKDEIDPFFVEPSVLIRNKGINQSSWFADLDLDGVGNDESPFEAEPSRAQPLSCEAVQAGPAVMTTRPCGQSSSSLPDVSTPLTAEVARAELFRMKYKFFDHKLSRALYEEWEASGFTLGQLHEAAASLRLGGFGDRTAGSLDKIMRGGCGKKRGTGRGSVAL